MLQGEKKKPTLHLNECSDWLVGCINNKMAIIMRGSRQQAARQLLAEASPAALMGAATTTADPYSEGRIRVMCCSNEIWMN